MKEDRVNMLNDVTDALVGVLDRDNNMTRCSAMRALARLGSVPDEGVDRVVKLLLEDEDPDVRMDAALVLGYLGGDKVVEPLVDALKNDPMGDVRIQSVNSLIRIGGDKVVGVLTGCLEVDEEYDEGVVQEEFGDDLAFNPNWEVQGLALKALAELGGEGVVDPVIKLIGNEDYEDMYETAFRVLGRTGNERARDFLVAQLSGGGRYARRRSAKALVACKGPGDEGLPQNIIDALIKALLDEEPSVRAYAAQALGESGTLQAVVPLTMLLLDKDKDVVAEVATVLGRMSGKEILGRLTELVDDPSWQLKYRVISILGEIGDPSSAEVVEKYFDVEDDSMQYEVIKALGRIAQPGTEERLIKLIFDMKKDASVRFQAVWALGEILNNKSPDAEAARAAGEVSEGADGEEGAADERADDERLDPVLAIERTCYDPVEKVAFSAQRALVAVDREKAVEVFSSILKGVSLIADVVVKGEEDAAREATGAVPDVAATDGAAPSDNAASSEEGAEQAPAPTEEEVVITGDAAVTELMKGVRETPNKEEISTLASIISDHAGKEYDRLKAENLAPKVVVLPAYRLSAARLLGEIKEDSAIEALVEVAAAAGPAGSDDWELYREVILSLGHIGETKVIEVVATALGSEKREVRMAALDAIEMIAGGSEGEGLDRDLVLDQMGAMATDPDFFVRHRVVQVLGKVGGDRAREILLDRLDDEAVSVRKEALLGLSRTGAAEEGLEKIKGLIFSHLGELRREAASTLRTLEDFSSTGELIEGLADPSREEEHWVCIEALAELYGTTEELRSY